jgi:hypothetical protein
MWPEKNAGIDPYRCQPIQDKAQRDQKGKQYLIFMDVREYKIFTDEGWRDRETGQSHVCEKKDQGNFGMLIHMSVKPVEAHPFSQFTQALDADVSDQS